MAIYADLMFVIINLDTGYYYWLMTIVGVWIVCTATKDTFSVGVVEIVPSLIRCQYLIVLIKRTLTIRNIAKNVWRFRSCLKL